MQLELYFGCIENAREQNLFFSDKIEFKNFLKDIEKTKREQAWVFIYGKSYQLKNREIIITEDIKDIIKLLDTATIIASGDYHELSLNGFETLEKAKKFNDSL